MSASSEAVVMLPVDLHARPAGQVTRAAASYEAGVWLSVDGRPEVDARSVLAVMALGAVTGERVRVRSVGPDAEEAAQAVASVLAAAEAIAG